MTKYLEKWIVGELHYRYSAEFAVEEAEAHEHRFTENGKLYR